MIQPAESTKQYVVILESSLIIQADHYDDDGENLTFWDELGVLIAKIPMSAIYTYDVQEAEVAA